MIRFPYLTIEIYWDLFSSKKLFCSSFGFSIASFFIIIFFLDDNSKQPLLRQKFVFHSQFWQLIWPYKLIQTQRRNSVTWNMQKYAHKGTILQTTLLISRKKRTIQIEIIEKKNAKWYVLNSIGVASTMLEGKIKITRKWNTSFTWFHVIFEKKEHCKYRKTCYCM